MERLYNEATNNKTTSNKQRQRIRTAHCIKIKVGRNGMPQIYLRSPPGGISFFRAVPRGRAVYFDNKVIPGGTKEIGETSQIKTGNSFPGASRIPKK